MMHTNLINIGKRIQASRKHKGLSPEDLAGLLQWKVSYYKRIEDGEEDILVQDLIALALCLEVELKELLPSLYSLQENNPQNKQPPLLRQSEAYYSLSSH